MNHPQHHSHIRKRIHLYRHSFPSQKRLIRWLDTWVAFFGVATSLSVLPQAIQIFANKDATNISLITWGTFFIWTSTMLVYGLAHRAVPIIITQCVGLVLYGLVVAGIIIY